MPSKPEGGKSQRAQEKDKLEKGEERMNEIQSVNEKQTVQCLQF